MFCWFSRGTINLIVLILWLYIYICPPELSFQLCDQLALLKNAWPELFILNFAHMGFGFPSNSTELGSPPTGIQSCRRSEDDHQQRPRTESPSGTSSCSGNQKNNRPMDRTLETLADLQEVLHNQFKRLKSLQMDLPEFACLKSILLFSSGEFTVKFLCELPKKLH